MLCLDTAFRLFFLYYFTGGGGGWLVRRSIIYSCFFIHFLLLGFKAGKQAAPHVSVCPRVIFRLVLCEGAAWKHLAVETTPPRWLTLASSALKLGCESVLDFLLLSQKLHVNLQCRLCSIFEARRPASSRWPVLTGGHFVSLGVCQLLLFSRTSRRLCVCAVTRRSLHVRRSVKFCRYRQQDSGTVPGAWQPLAPSPHLMTVLSCQPLVSAISPRIQIVTVFLAAQLPHLSPPPLPGKLSNVEFL